MLLDKPVITIEASVRVDKGINISNISELREAIDSSLISPKEYRSNRKKYLDEIHPYIDINNSKRVLDSVITFFRKNEKLKLKKKPINLFRKYKINKKFNYK